MNVLVNYASDSDSETEQKTPSTRRHVPQTKDDVDNDFVLAALKDIQSFAASTETSPSKDNSESTQRTTDGPIAATAGDTSVDDLGFLSFLKEIDAIPCPPEDQAQAAPPPPSPPSTPPTVDCVVPPPPPPSLPTIQADDGESVLELASRDTKTIYTQMYHLWLLPSISIDQKDLERRLLEFAIRIRDWEKGGLYEHYFLGKDRAGTVSIAGSSSIVELPPYGGVVGSMIKQLYELEQMAAPSGWTAVWDTEDEAYGFHHIRTGTYSPVYPSQELLHYLDPPPRSSGSPVSSRNTSRSFFASRPTLYSTDASVSRSAGESSSEGVISVSGGSSQGNVSSPSSPLTSIGSGSVVTKTKKRKAESIMADKSAEDNVFSDQHIHPSRRAALGSRPQLGSPSSSAAKVMPKKLASLLQKWSEKDMEDEESDEDEDRGEHVSSAGAMTGSNSQSLGGDWRERRPYSK